MPFKSVKIKPVKEREKERVETSEMPGYKYQECRYALCLCIPTLNVFIVTKSMVLTSTSHKRTLPKWCEKVLESFRNVTKIEAFQPFGA